VPLKSVINRVGTSRACDVCLADPLADLRLSAGLAAEEVAAAFSEVHALVRVDLHGNGALTIATPTSTAAQAT